MYEPPRYLAPVLWLPGLMFRAAVGCRNRLYGSGIIGTRRLQNPVISVGNITAGGSGKTPMVMHIAEVISRAGATPVLLSRGYGAQPSGAPRVIAPDDALRSVSELGDEPVLVRVRCPGIWLGVDRDRYRAGCAVEARLQDPVFILDDGFQHRALHRDFDIVMIDDSQPLEDNRLLPAGSLREPLSALRRADAIVLNGGSAHRPERLGIRPNAMVFCCSQEIRSLPTLEVWKSGTNDAGDASAAGPVFLIAAVGNPRRFRRDAERVGLDVRGQRFFRDHHRLTSAEWKECRAAALKSGAGTFLITEKDAVKLDGAPGLPVRVAVQQTRMVDPSGFKATIEKVVGIRS
jgi:tetraacyldisaccharide 4'-kinase